MLGQPSLQYRIYTLLIALFLALAFYFNSLFSNSWSVMKYRYRTTRDHYLSVTIGHYEGPSLVMQALDSAQTAVNTIVAFILAMIATIIGVNLIGPVATAVGGALNNKNLTGAANSLTAQITLLFVVVVILGVVVFIAVLGKMASSESA